VVEKDVDQMKENQVQILNLSIF